MLEDKIESVANGLDFISDQLNPLNDFGNSVGDELHQIEYQITRVADALEGILKIMKK
jgi:hypothetical protein